MQEVPSPARADQRAVRSPLPLAVWPRTQLRQAPTGGPAAPQAPGKGAGGWWTGQLRGHSPPRCQLRRGQAREGRGRGRLTRQPYDCPGLPALPRSARGFPSCSICGRLTPSGASAPPGASVLWGGAARSGPSSPPRPSWRSAPGSPPGARAFRRASARPELPAGRGASPPLARGRESPPLQSHLRAGPPSRDPQQKTDWSARPGSP